MSDHISMEWKSALMTPRVPMKFWLLLRLLPPSPSLCPCPCLSPALSLSYLSRHLALVDVNHDEEACSCVCQREEKPLEAIDAAGHAKSTIQQELSKSEPPSAPPAPIKPVDENAPLLPLETIKALSLNAGFDLQQLTIQKLPIQNITIGLTASDGLITMNKANGELYDGNFKANATIDARSDKVTWKAHKEINNIQSHPLLQTLAELGILSGGINFKADFNSQGNSIAALKKSTKGNASFFLKEGALNETEVTQVIELIKASL